MCTVTYLPFAQQGYILTSNRDEAPQRSPECISKLSLSNGQELFLPRDTGGGSWIVGSSSGRVACLLNGGFEIHQRQLPYRRSRGLVVLDLFEYPSVPEFWDDYNWDNIEPFTLVIVDGMELFEGVWDGKRVWLTKKDAAQPHLWASSTLYNAERRAERQVWFRQWLQESATFSPTAIENFHRTGGKGDAANDLIMQRPEGVQTVSVTQIVQQADAPREMVYHHLLDGKSDRTVF